MFSRRAFLAGTVGALATGPLLTSCGSSGSGRGTSRLTVLAPLLDTEAPAKDNEIVTRVTQLVGKPLDITWVPNSSYPDKLNVLMASGQLPQIVVVTNITPTFIQAAEAGAFWELTGRLADHPNLASPDPDVQRNASVNGKVYGLYRPRDVMRGGVVLRKDWLAKLGLSAPTTTAELRAVAQAFTASDPDGNGKGDTYGIIIPRWDAGLWSNSPFDNVETWYGAPNGWGLSGSSLVPSFETDAFLAADDYLRGMIAGGLVNKNFATLDSGRWNEPFLNGKAGIIIDTGSRALQLHTLFRQRDPATAADKVTMVGALTGPDGSRHALPTAGFSGLVAFSKQALPTEQDLEAALTVMDRLASREGQILINNGIEGKNFAVQDNHSVPMSSDPNANKSLTDAVKAYAQLGVYGKEQYFYKAGLLDSDPVGQALLKLREQVYAADLKVAVYDASAGLQSATWTAKGAQITATLSDARIRYLAGQIDAAGLKAAITRWRQAGGDKVAAELTALYDKNAG